MPETENQFLDRRQRGPLICECGHLYEGHSERRSFDADTGTTAVTWPCQNCGCYEFQEVTTDASE